MAPRRKSEARINEIYRKIGSRIIAARKALHWKQDTLAKATGLSRTSIVLIERGQQRPPIDRLYRIAHELGGDITTLLPPAQEFFQAVKGQSRFDASGQELSKTEAKAIEFVLRKTST